jgi:hypothetical protein
MRDSISRRGILIAGGGLLLGACGSATSSSAGARTTPTTSRSSSTSKPGATPHGRASDTATASASGRIAPLPEVKQWQPNTNDVYPPAKLTAVRRIEALGNTRETATQVIDAQYGGILTDTASVLVVCRSWRRRGEHITEGGATYDVRLSRTGERWRVTAIHPSQPGAAARTLPTAARDVLKNNRIALPPAARADVESGKVHVSVLHAMLGLAETYEIGVSVVRSGHPIHVFGSDRLSDHPRGRAFDTWQINGHAVIDPSTSRRLVIGFMEAAASAGSYNVGGPYLLGSAPQYFSDNTHHDHVHAGFLA